MFLLKLLGTWRNVTNKCSVYESRSKLEVTSLQSFASIPFWIGLTTPASLTSVSLVSNSHAFGGTSTAGEQLKNPWGCSHRHKRKVIGSDKNSSETKKKILIIKDWNKDIFVNIISFLCIKETYLLDSISKIWMLVTQSALFPKY